MSREMSAKSPVNERSECDCHNCLFGPSDWKCRTPF